MCHSEQNNISHCYWGWWRGLMKCSRHAVVAPGQLRSLVDSGLRRTSPGHPPSWYLTSLLHWRLLGPGPEGRGWTDLGKPSLGHTTQTSQELCFTSVKRRAVYSDSTLLFHPMWAIRMSKLQQTGAHSRCSERLSWTWPSHTGRDLHLQVMRRPYQPFFPQCPMSQGW